MVGDKAYSSHETRRNLVIRNFVPTTAYEAENHQKQQQAKPTKELVLAVAATANIEETVDIDSIPF